MTRDGEGGAGRRGRRRPAEAVATAADGEARPGGDASGAPGSPDPAPALSRPVEERPEIAVVAPAGRMPYREGLELQRRLARARIDGELRRDLLLLVEHDPVLTLGRGTEEGHLRADPERLDELGVDAVEIERGGDVTYHGPGQLVGYPILDLRSYRKDLHWYLRAVEEALIRALGELGLPAFRVPEHTGVWVGEVEAVTADAGDGGAAPGAAGGAHAEAGSAGDAAGSPGEARPEAASGRDAHDPTAAILEGRVRKIASIGVHVSRWVTWHGFALNVTDEPMENFELIVPCGISGVRMTSLEAEGAGAGLGRVRESVAAGFASVFDARVVDHLDLAGVADPTGLSGGPAAGEGGA